MRRLIGVVMLLAGAALSGESSPIARPRIVTPPTAAPAVDVSRLNPPPTGFSVTAQLDSSRAVSQVIPPEGGTISATAADGTVFTLTLPNGALLSEEEITLTPVASIDRLPLSGGLSAAVQLAPEGLLLFQPATLVIDSPIPIPIDEEITFAWHGTGQQFFLYPPDPLPTSSITLGLTRFSGYGAGRGTSADQAAQEARLQADPEDQLAQDLQGPAAEERAAARSGGSVVQAEAAGIVRPAAQTAAQARATQRLTNYFLNKLDPLSPKGCNEDWGSFLNKLKQLERNVNKFTGSPPDPTLLGGVQADITLVYSLLVQCYEIAYSDCKSIPNPVPGGDMIRIYWILTSAGQGSRIDQSKIPKCLTFELTFTDTVLEIDYASTGFVWNHFYGAKVLGSVFGPFPAGSGPANYVSLYVGPAIPTCTEDTTGGPATFTILDIRVDSNVFFGRAILLDNQLSVFYDPGSPSWSWSLTCPPPANVFTLGPQTRWRDIYQGLHQGQVAGSGFVATAWNSAGPGVFARKTITAANSLATDKTILELRHKPQ